uniref:(northern house mosquito) hypothetical protein n=1 Tax=Culex pipiens TaxID=7175 RepID=A0A8D8JIA1_CULPI
MVPQLALQEQPQGQEPERGWRRTWLPQPTSANPDQAHRPAAVFCRRWSSFVVQGPRHGSLQRHARHLPGPVQQPVQGVLGSHLGEHPPRGRKLCEAAPGHGRIRAGLETR